VLQREEGGVGGLYSLSVVESHNEGHNMEFDWAPGWRQWREHGVVGGENLMGFFCVGLQVEEKRKEEGR